MKLPINMPVSIKALILIGCLGAACLSGGCSLADAPQLANELHFNLGAVSEIRISYDEENVTFLPSDNEELVIKEYMNKRKKSYNAKVQEGEGRIQVREGKKPLFAQGFSRYVEVYLPQSYEKSLTVTTTNGAIKIADLDLQLTDLGVDSSSGSVAIEGIRARNIRLASTSGPLSLGTITGEKIDLATTSGKITCQRLVGQVDCVTTSGDITVRSGTGLGEYRVNNSGQMKIAYSEVRGDLILFNKNGPIHLRLPQALAFKFTGYSKNAAVHTSFAEFLTSEGKTSRGVVGTTPLAM